MDTPCNKATAIEFLAMAAAGDVRAAFERHVADSFRHHNPHFAGDRAALMRAMEESAAAEPNKSLHVVRALEEADTVAVFSRLARAAGAEYAVVHILRFEHGKIAELWDIVQEVPPHPANEHGMF
jgi:predicted SnoaL-like aldol condensation-catalyzing enzyme